MVDDEAQVPFGRFRLVGGRYDRKGLPVSSAPELQRYERLVSSVARSLYLASHPRRQRVPRGFDESLDLRLTEIGNGSVTPVLVRRESQVTSTEDWHEEARRLINDALIRLSAPDPSLPPNFPAAALREFAQFGRSLGDDEHIELSGGEERPARLDHVTRRRIQERAAMTSIEVETAVIGQVTGLRSSPQQFDLVLAPGGQQVVGAYLEPTTWDDLRAFHDYVDRAPLASLSVVARQDLAGQLLEIVDVMAIEPALPPDWAERLHLLSQLKEGWLQPGVEAPSRNAVDAAEDVLFGCHDEGLPRPRVYPALEGGVQLEWASLERGDVEVLVRNDGAAQVFLMGPAAEEVADFQTGDLDGLFDHIKALVS